MKKALTLPVIFLSVLSVVSCQKVQELSDEVSFANPLLLSGPDPWVIQKDSVYYYTSTLSNALEIRKTRSMSRLKNSVQKIIWTPKANTENGYNIWAPELHFLDGKWYMYYTAGSSAGNGFTQRIFVLENSAADPTAGDWKDMGKIADPEADYFAIDASVFEIDSVKYMVWSSVAVQYSDKQSIFIARLKNPWTLATKRVMIAAPQYDWEKTGMPAASGINEGPEILKNSKGNIFLVYSGSSCWTDSYGLGILSLKSGGDPLNPDDWVKKQTPVFISNTFGHAYGPGHNAFFKSPDSTQDWIIYHANPDPNEGCLGKRSPRIQKFGWNADGTPNFGQPLPTDVKILRPSGEKD